jgi:hypothetical protein
MFAMARGDARAPCFDSPAISSAQMILRHRLISLGDQAVLFEQEQEQERD